MPLPVPDGVTVHQVWLLVAVHAEVVVTVNGVVPAGVVTFWFGGVTDRVGPEAVPVIETSSTPQYLPYVPV